MRWTRWSWLASESHGRRIVSVVDVDADKSRERDLHDRATHDPLTGLANRRQFVETLEHRVSTLAGDGRGALALIYLDLDRFKEVNDAGGHGMGDEVLACVAQRLMAATRPDDLVGRLGGDEFGVICADLPSTADVTPLVGRLLGAFATPIDVRGARWPLSAAVGVAIATAPCDPEQVVRVADGRMYAAKRRARTSLADHEVAAGAGGRARRTIGSVVRDAGHQLVFGPTVSPGRRTRSSSRRGWRSSWRPTSCAASGPGRWPAIPRRTRAPTGSALPPARCGRHFSRSDRTSSPDPLQLSLC